MHIYQVLLRPIVTEKSMDQREENKYSFEVATKANKRQIQEAVEKIFKVNVVDVRTMLIKGKQRRWGRTFYKTPTWKKAVVKLAEGESITFFEGV
ncbi:MAG: 50S ribosomal protein L23 [Ardenticatenales bacterium]|nr:50S ribosomal protein L23 [Ardenticatenales bacterium]